MKSLKPLHLLSPLLLLCLAQSAHSASVVTTWAGPLSGIQFWDNNTNWNPGADYPHNVPDAYSATLANNSAGNLTVQTPAGDPALSRFIFTQSGSGSTTLKLGGNFSVVSGAFTAGPGDVSTFSNANAASPGKLVLDLNGHTFSAGSGNTNNNTIRYARNYTIKDTSTNGNGVFEINTIAYQAGVANGRVNVENNVTVKVTGALTMDLRGDAGSTTEGWNFAPTSTLWIAGAGDPSQSNIGGTFGNIIVGDAANAVRTRWRVASSFTVAGNVTYASSTGGTGSFIGLAAGATMTLLGNITDKNTNSEDYSSSVPTARLTTIQFAGGINKEQEVWIAKQGLSTRFQVGADATTRGNVKLLHNLTTTSNGVASTGMLAVAEGSRIDLDTYKVTASRVQFATTGLTPTLALTFGENSDALIHITSTLAADFTLGKFTLELAYNDEGWVNGSDLLLFRYNGSSFTGSPELASLLAPDILSHDGLAWGDIGGINYVYLQNVVVVPEPTALLLLGAGAFVFLVRRRGARPLANLQP